MALVTRKLVEGAQRSYQKGLRASGQTKAHTHYVQGPPEIPDDLATQL